MTSHEIKQLDWLYEILKGFLNNSNQTEDKLFLDAIEENNGLF